MTRPQIRGSIFVILAQMAWASIASAQGLVAADFRLSGWSGEVIVLKKSAQKKSVKMNAQAGQILDERIEIRTGGQSRVEIRWPTGRFILGPFSQLGLKKMKSERYLHLISGVGRVQAQFPTRFFAGPLAQARFSQGDLGVMVEENEAWIQKRTNALGDRALDRGIAVRPTFVKWALVEGSLSVMEPPQKKSKSKEIILIPGETLTQTGAVPAPAPVKPGENEIKFLLERLGLK